jgi:hypothetical protein
MTRVSKSRYGGRPSLKARENEEIRRSTSHLPKKSKQKEPSPIDTEEEELDDPEPEPASSDVSQVLFELSTCSLLGLERVCSDFRQFRLGEFSVYRYLAQSIKKATTKAAATGNGVTFVRGEAELQNKSLSKKQYPIMDVTDDAEWRKVENNLEDWMQKKKANIRVDLKFYYDRTGTVVAPPPGMAVKTSKAKVYTS